MGRKIYFFTAKFSAIFFSVFVNATSDLSKNTISNKDKTEKNIGYFTLNENSVINHHTCCSKTIIIPRIFKVFFIYF